MGKVLTKLKCRIKEWGTQGEFACELGISETSLNMKVNGKSAFSISEIKNTCDILDIPYKDIDEYFF